MKKQENSTVKQTKPTPRKAVRKIDNNDEALAPFVGTLFRTITEADDRQIVIVCFGTTAISGDSLGPMVGSILREKYNVPAFVYGTEEHSVNGKNMAEWMKFIRAVHEDALIIAVDASLGHGDMVGQIMLRNDGVCPAAIKGKKTRFGDVGILGVVAESSKDPIMQLMTVSPLYVEDMAHKVSNLLNQALFA
ncbi:MAG: spore protease YyaC [Clostridia bacterium]|nr:spore protease YyaC [Clostridia bacterium]